jgi:hypothetical protein
MMTTTTLEFTRHGYRFTLAKGGTFINVRPVEASMRSVPEAMIAVPEWVNRSKMTEQALRAIALDFLAFGDSGS